MKKLLNKVSSIILVCLVGTCLLILVGRAQGRGGFIVLSGSMEPTYPVGGLVITKKVPFEALKVGDSITFQSQGKSNKIVTHRIIELDQQAGEAKTQGDANQVADGQVVLAEDLIGKVTMGIPYVGYILTIFQSNTGRWIILMGMILILLWQVIQTFFLSKESALVKATPSDGGR